MTIDNFVAQYANYRDIRPGTIEQYKYTVKSLSRFLNRPAQLQDLHPDTVNRWLRSLSGKLSPFTIHSKRGQLLVLWRAAIEMQKVEEAPRTIRSIKRPERVVRTINPDEAALLVHYLSCLTGSIAGRPRGPYLVSLVRATLDTSLRQSDLHLLDWEATEKSDGKLQIVQVKTRRRRWVYLSQETLELIRPWAQSGPIWPRKRRDRVTREIQSAARACGLGRLTHTDLRRSAIRSVEEQSPGSGWIFAGHESDATTRTWYLPKDLQYDGLPRPKF